VNETSSVHPGERSKLIHRAKVILIQKMRKRGRAEGSKRSASEARAQRARKLETRTLKKNMRIGAGFDRFL